MTKQELIEKCVAKYGEQNRDLVETGVEWLEKIEPAMHLDRPLDREEVISGFVETQLAKARGVN